MICLQPAEDEHFASFLCRQLHIRGEVWSVVEHKRCFLNNKGGAPRFIPGPDHFSLYAKMMRKSEAQFFDEHTLFLLLVIYHQERSSLPPAPEDVSLQSALHFCASCMIESVQSNGWAYIKRSWVVPGVRSCLKHKKKLIDIRSVYCGCYSLRDVRLLN